MQAPAAAGEVESYLPHKPLNIKTTKGASPRQEQYLKEFIRSYVERTRQSKRIAQASRGPLADSALSVGFTLMLKELVYPIYEQRASGSRVWDVDGNEYLDLAMGYGVNLFGNAPPFITQAVEEQLRQGIALVPQLELTGKVAELICRLTGVERVNFCNSGTEAVMGALRAARTITRRRRIAMFTGSYHGWSDGTLARSVQGNGQTRSIPVAPGVNPKAVEDALVLDYGSPQSLETLEAHANELAAILVEPVQSRRPDLQPREFLHALRELTSRSGAALIFDEMITGFRVHPGGAQAWFGVQADLVTYGKIVGGGMPIGVIAGKAAFMDAFDGGRWTYGDASYPEVDKTFFAAAFFKHPLSMAAAWATLNRLAESGPALQEDLNRRTAGMAQTLNDLFAANGAPIHVAHFASLFRFAFGKELKHAELFAYHLIHKGFLTWEGGNFYLSTAHSEDDVRAIISGVAETVEDLRRGGFLPEPGAPTGAGWRTHDAAGAALVSDGARASAAESAGGAAPARCNSVDQTAG
jgi:glutamate-1-semialdehyde aminotransferase